MSEKITKIRELFELINIESLGIQMFEQTIGSLSNGIPGLDDEFWKSLMSYFDIEDLMNKIVFIYNKHFSLGEIEGLISFYKTDIGQKLIQVNPTVMNDSMIIGQQWAEESYNKFEPILKLELEKSNKRISLDEKESK